MNYTLITGASSGIGRATAIQLSASRGLILCGRNAERLKETLAACKDPDRHKIWSFDLANVESVDREISMALGQFDVGVEGFVHCAGEAAVQPLRLTDRAVHFQRLMDVNFVSAVEILRALMRGTTNAYNLASVVFVSSTASRFGAKGMTAYCASKGALDAFMRAAAVELAPRVRVNSVLPGAVPTSMTNRMLVKVEDYPLGFGDVGAIAEAIQFLLDSRWITGESLVVDGGRTVDISA